MIVVQIDSEKFVFSYRKLIKVSEPNPEKWCFGGVYSGEKPPDYIVPSSIYDVRPVWRKEISVKGRSFVGFYSMSGLEKIADLVRKYQSSRNDAGGKAVDVKFESQTIYVSAQSGYGCCINGLNEIQQPPYDWFLPDVRKLRRKVEEALRNGNEKAIFDTAKSLGVEIA